MVLMTETIEQDPTAVIVGALADSYRRTGYHQVAVPAAALLGVVGSREVLEPALARLLDGGDVVAVGGNGVALAPGARAALLSRGVLTGWLSSISRETGTRLALYRDAVARELTTLVDWAVTVGPPADLTQRAAELAGVLATVELDPRAIEVVATHGGTPRSRLEALAAVRPRTLAMERLRDHLRNTVSTAHPAG